MRTVPHIFNIGRNVKVISTTYLQVIGWTQLRTVYFDPQKLLLAVVVRKHET